MYNKSLDTFKAVAESGSFTKAAEQLYITHTAVIKQINQLEGQLGVRLFVRSHHGVTLTAAGQYLYGRLPAIFQELEQLIQSIRQIALETPKTIRIGTSTLYPCHDFMALWDQFSEQYPQFRLKIVPFENDGDRYARLDTDYDFVIGPCNSLPYASRLKFVPVGEYLFYIAMPKKHPLACRKEVRLKDLGGETLMMKENNSPVNDSIRRKILRDYPDIRLLDIESSYSTATFNRCAEENHLLLSLECWKDLHPALVSLPLREGFKLPFGIICSARPREDVADFLSNIQTFLLREQNNFCPG